MNFPLSVRRRLIKYAIICKRVRVPIYEHAFADILSARMHALARSRPVHYNPLSIARARARAHTRKSMRPSAVSVERGSSDNMLACVSKSFDMFINIAATPHRTAS